jgi:diaminopimelate epimerase
MPDPQECRRVAFFKMHGGGNDFILIDHRERCFPRPEQPKLARRLCAPKVGVGADGLILLETSDRADVAWRFYNADGSEAEMCGNGARCAARFAVLQGLAGPRLTLETLAGIIHCEVMDRSARVQLTDVDDLRLHLEIPLGEESLTGHFLRVGVPHTVIPVADLETVPVTRWGRAVRFHPLFQPAGTNVNFITVGNPHELWIRTYERGVEDETLACGTGSVAAALIAARLEEVRSPVLVHTRGGEVLTVTFAPGEPFREVYLEGETRVVFEGRLWLEEIL